MFSILNSQKNPLFKFSYKRIIILFILAISIYFFIPKLVGFKEGLKLLRDVKPIYLVLGILGEAISYTGAALLLRLVIKKMKYHNLSFLDLIRMGTIGAFAIHFFPVSGAGEATINYYLLRAKEVSAGDALFVFIIRSIFFYIAFFLIFALGLIIIPIHPHLTFNQKVVSIILFIIVVSFTLWVKHMYQRKDRFWSAGYKILGTINFFSQKIFKKRAFGPETCEIIISDIFDGFRDFSRDRQKWLPGTSFGMIYWLGDMLCLFFSLMAFGYVVNPGVLIFAYCVATLAGLISFIPGGIGIVEGTMSLTLIGLGVPSTVAVFAVLLYRLLSFWLIMPVGFVSFFTLQGEISFNNRKKREKEMVQ